MSAIKEVKARETKQYPKAYQKYLKKELAWVKSRIGYTDSLLDAGCGDGRLTPILSKLCNHYVGVDLDAHALSKANRFKSNRIKFLKADLAKLSKHFRKNSFETVVCLWNTLGNIENDQQALSELFWVASKTCLITVVKKGNLKKRIDYYKKLKSPYSLDKKTETFHSKAWGVARAYSKAELRKMCQKAGFKVKEIVSLGKIGIGASLEKW